MRIGRGEVLSDKAGMLHRLAALAQDSHPCRMLASGFEDADLGVADSVGVVVDVDLLDVGFALLEVEMLDVILLAAVNVDGFFVDENEGAGKVDFADHIRYGRDVDDHKIVASDRTQADGVGGIGFMRPVITFSREMQKAAFAAAGATD